MKAAMIFTGTGPILVLTAYDTLDDPKLSERLMAKGIDRFIAFEVPVEKVREKYGQHFSVTLGDLKQADDLRVVDEEGHRVFYNFALEDLGKPHCLDLAGVRKAA
jgi:hypothetical protein